MKRGCSSLKSASDNEKSTGKSFEKSTGTSLKKPKTTAVQPVVAERPNTDSVLFVYQLAHDLILDSVLMPLTKANGVPKRNLPSSLWKEFRSKPSFGFFSMLVEVGEKTDLMEQFMSVFPNFLNELSKLVVTDPHRMLFMTYIFWMFNSLFLDKEIQFYWRSEVGFGIKTGTNLAKGDLMRACWADRVEVDLEKMNSLKSSGILVVNVHDKDTNKQRHFALFGPMTFLQQACKFCCNIAFQQVMPPKCSSVFNPPTKVTEELLTCCFTYQSVRAGQELMYLHLGRCTSPKHTAVHTPPSVSL